MEFNLSELSNVAFRSILSLVALFLVTKMLGKKQVSQLSLFDYVIGISIGNFSAEICINLDTSYVNGIFAVFIFGFVAYFISILTMKSIILRRYFMGVPTVLIQNGKLMIEGLKKVKFDVNDLLEQCRSSGYFDISEIEYAIMEVNGKLSFLPKGENKQLTVKDMNLKPEKQGLCANVIIDGKIMANNLNNIGKSEDWLLKQIQIKGKILKNILLATIDHSDKLLFYERNEKEKTINVLE